MFVAEKDGDDPCVVKYERSLDFAVRMRRVWRRKRIARAIGGYRRTMYREGGGFSDDRSAFGGDPWTKLPENDVLNVHWVAGFLDYQKFFQWLPEGKPVVWTLHDMGVFTGGCHWDADCGKFVQRCGACPQLGSSADDDLSREIWARKRQAFERVEGSRLRVVAPSRWLAAEARRSSVLGRFVCSVIPYGVDTEVFAPRDKRMSREILEIPTDAKVVLFLADDIHARRKGFYLLAEALAGIAADANVFLLSMGAGNPPEIAGLRRAHLKHMRRDGILSCVYSAADIFVAPSTQDNLPNTVLESMACGTPVAAFAVGGIPDVVRPGVTGLLARPGDVEGLRVAILELLRDDEKRAETSANCRSITLREYGLEVQARRYLELYREMIRPERASEAKGQEQRETCPQPLSR
jgi:glycosyltransferase involved in cell wall biosynthesis